ncbi:PIN domain-containing protein [bacterium]|nr:PIN domain-containing protein [bacterium]
MKGSSFLLDTSALFAFTDDEEGADEVQHRLENALQGKSAVFVSSMSIMEAYYVTLQEQGEADADRIVLLIRSLPIQELPLTDDLTLPAGSFKGRYQISVADAWIAATAKLNRLILMHKDPEFEPLKEELDLIELPYELKRRPHRRRRK